jgi:hypothetical protein
VGILIIEGVKYMAYKTITWRDSKFNGFRMWLDENFGITLVKNKNTFQVQSPGEYSPTIPVIPEKVFLYAREYFTDFTNTIGHNNCYPYDIGFKPWWYTGQELWPRIKSSVYHNDISDIRYFTEGGDSR